MEQDQKQEQAQEVSLHKTNHEIRFVRLLGMGKWSESKAVAKAGREQMLRRYKEASLNRSNWDGIDQGAVMAAVDRELIYFEGQRRV